MIAPKHVPILRANKGELKCLMNLDKWTLERTMPLLDIGVMTESIWERKYIKESSSPKMTYLDRSTAKIAEVWSGGAVMLDGYNWAYDAVAENGEHVIPLMVRMLRAKGLQVVPVVGYDRWGNAEYEAAMASIPKGDGNFALRLDSAAVDDSGDPDHFLEVIQDMLDTLEIDPGMCTAIIDHGDVSTNANPVAHLIEASQRIIDLLEQFGFSFVVVAGCSMPKTIDQAVEDTDSEGQLLRKELLVWKALSGQPQALPIILGDYGVRGPTTTEIRSKYTNGKIRHTVSNGVFVVRGHAFRNDGGFGQMPILAQTLRNSTYFLGEDFSWGDAQIAACLPGSKPGDLSHWIAIDTNHHITFAVQEVVEFENSIVVAAGIPA